MKFHQTTATFCVLMFTLIYSATAFYPGSFYKLILQLKRNEDGKIGRKAPGPSRLWGSVTSARNGVQGEKSNNQIQNSTNLTENLQTDENLSNKPMKLTYDSKKDNLDTFTSMDKLLSTTEKYTTTDAINSTDIDGFIENATEIPESSLLSFPDEPIEKLNLLKRKLQKHKQTAWRIVDPEYGAKKNWTGEYYKGRKNSRINKVRNRVQETSEISAGKVSLETDNDSDIGKSRKVSSSNTGLRARKIDKCGDSWLFDLDPHKPIQELKDRVFHKVIHTPTFGDQHTYPQDLNCSWVLHIGSSCRYGMIVYTVRPSKIKRSHACLQDHLDIMYNGNRISRSCGPLSKKITGAQVWSDTLPKNVTVLFQSGHQNDHYGISDNLGVNLELSAYCWGYSKEFKRQLMKFRKQGTPAPFDYSQLVNVTEADEPNYFDDLNVDSGGNDTTNGSSYSSQANIDDKNTLIITNNLNETEPITEIIDDTASNGSENNLIFNGSYHITTSSTNNTDISPNDTSYTDTPLPIPANDTNNLDDHSSENQTSSLEPLNENLVEITTLESHNKNLVELTTSEPFNENLLEITTLEPPNKNLVELTTLEPFNENLLEITTLEPPNKNLDKLTTLEPFNENILELTTVNSLNETYGSKSEAHKNGNFSLHFNTSIDNNLNSSEIFSNITNIEKIQIISEIDDKLEINDTVKNSHKDIFIETTFHNSSIDGTNKNVTSFDETEDYNSVSNVVNITLPLVSPNSGSTSPQNYISLPDPLVSKKVVIELQPRFSNLNTNLSVSNKVSIPLPPAFGQMESPRSGGISRRRLEQLATEHRSRKKLNTKYIRLPKNVFSSHRFRLFPW